MKAFLKLILLHVLTALISADCMAQLPPPQEPDALQEQKLEDVSETSGEDADLSELIEQRRYYSVHPLDLNNASYEELIESGLLNELQVQALLMHINRYGKLMTVEELQTIDGYDIYTIKSLQPYIIIRPGQDLARRGLKDVLTNGRQQVIIRLQQVLEEQKGFSPPEDLSDTRYSGSALKLYSRYRFTFENKVSAGITGEKDAGEQFFNGNQQNGFDFYSAHIYINDGPLRIAAGDYQLKYGQGLVLWTGLAAGKTTDVVNIKRSATAIRPYTSVNEFSYLRGGAASYSWKHVSIDAFCSFRQLDANTIVADSVQDDLLITAFSEDGYHRTPAETAKKNAVKSRMAGYHIGYRNKGFDLGATGFYNEFSVPLQEKDQLFNRYDASGSQFYNTGINYSWSIRNLLLFGETARSGNNAIATLNGIMLALDRRASFSVLYRNYARDYELLFNNAFRESDNANEKGLYIGFSLTPLKSVTWNNYIDFFRFDWLRFNADAPSSGTEWLSQLTWTPDKRTVLYIKFKQEDKEENGSSDYAVSRLQNVRQRNIRLNASYKISNSFTLQSRFELHLRKSGDQSVENGTLLFQDIKYSRMGSPFTLAFRYAVFDTDNYDTRIYAFENDIPGVFSIPSYYYKGSRFYAMIRYKISRNIDFWLRYGTSLYDNMDAIGSGLDEISANHKSDVKLQLRFEF